MPEPESNLKILASQTETNQLDYEVWDRKAFWHPGRQMEKYTPSDQVFMATGDGYTLRDTRGNCYIDGNSGVWCMSLGYSNERIKNAVNRQLEQLPFSSLSAFSHVPAATLAHTLGNLIPNCGGHVHFTTSGAEAVDAALKLARQFFRQNGQEDRTVIISFCESYHGLTIGALSVTGLSSQKRQHGNLLSDCIHIPFPNCSNCPWSKQAETCGMFCISALMEDVKRIGESKIAAFFVEPIAASGGMLLPPKGYLNALEEISRKCGSLLIFDEITTGCGRLGYLFAFNYFNVTPDIFLVSKGLTGGYQPLGALIASEAVYKGFMGDEIEGRDFKDFHTFAGHPAACAAANEAINIVSAPEFLSNVQKLGLLLENELQGLKSELTCIREVRGIGLLWGVELQCARTKTPIARDIARQISCAAMKRGLIIRSLRDAPHVIAIVPPLIIDADGITNLCAIFRASIEDVVT